MDSIEVVLAMLLAVVASGYLVRALRISLPLPLVQIALGAVVAGALNHGVVLEPDMFFLLFLPPLLFLDGWRIPNDGLLRDRRVILQLALGLVVFTVAGAGALLHGLIPSMPLPVAFALAAIVSPTDPVAVGSITARAHMPRRLMHILEGESLLNDASGLVCFRFAVAAALTGRFSFASASLTFLWLALAGVGIGVGFTSAVAFAQRWMSRNVDEPSGSPILVSLLIPFGSYMLAEHVHASGILAAVAAGITMSFVELTGRARATTRVERTAVWDTLQFALNGVMFVLLGEQLPDIVRGAVVSTDAAGHRSAWWLAVYVLALFFGLTLLRVVWIWTSLRVTGFNARRRGEAVARPSGRLLVATSLSGVRGAITLAGVMTLPLRMPNGAPFPARGLAVFLAAAEILLSLGVASFALPRVLKGLTLPDEPAEQMAEDRVRREAALAAIGAIESAQKHVPEDAADAAMYAHAAFHVIGLYQHRLDHGIEGNAGPNVQRDAAKAERELRLTGLKAERQTIFEMARERRISDSVARTLVREIDLVESLYPSLPSGSSRG
jgi:Na+/H+ antiporter